MEDERTLGSLLQRAAAVHGSRPFVTYGETCVSYADAAEQVERYAAAFTELGVRHGDKVALFLPNGLTILWSWLALARIGAVEVPLNTEYKAAQVAQALRVAGARALVAHDRFADVVDQAVCDVPELALLVFEGEARNVPRGQRRHGLVTYRLGDCLDRTSSGAPGPALTRRVLGHDLVAILQTSGTSGPPKGVMLCHNHEYVLGRNIANDMGLSSDDVFYNFYPMFHNTAQGIITCAVLHAGAHMVLRDKFSSSQFWPDVDRHGCTAFYYMGSILQMVLARATDDDAARTHALRIGWGISAAEEDLVAFAERFSVELRGGYGSTEANIPCYFPRSGRPAHSVGRAIPGWTVRIVGEADEPLPPNHSGEIVVRPEEPYTIMQGYVNAPEDTLAAWRNLWFHTGDAGYLDEDGNLFFVDRIKDVIRRRGETISSYEVERVLLEHPGVEECAAVPVPAELGEHEVKVVLVGDERVGLEILVAHCEEHLPAYAVPRYYQWVPELPRTQTGKVRKGVLRESAFTPDTWDRLPAASSDRTTTSSIRSRGHG